MTTKKPDSARSSQARRINQRTWDGKRVLTVGRQYSFWRDLAHLSLTVSWTKFFLVMALIFIALNVVFAVLYMLGPNSLANMPEESLLYYFYFSVETLGTVGYGDMHPQSHWGHVIACIETFTGLFYAAIVTGLVFSRYTRPQARILFSRNALIGKHDGEKMLMMRLANERHNSIADARAKLWLISTKSTLEGRRYRSIDELPLSRTQNPTFFLSWTLFHPINAQSPLFEIDLEGLKDLDAAFILTIQGYDETAAQMVYSRHYYSSEEILFDHHYVDIIGSDAETVRIDYTKFHLADVD